MSTIISSLWPYLAGLGALLVAIVGARLKWTRDGRKAEIARAHERSLKTIERIEDAKDRAAAGGGDWHDRLRRDGK